MALLWGTAHKGTWSFLGRQGLVLWSNGVLGGSWQSTLATTSQSTGKFVVEFYMSTWDSNNNGQVVGFGNASINTGSYLGSDSNSFGVQTKTGWSGLTGGWSPGGGGSDVSGFVVQLAIDLGNSLIWGRTDRNLLWNNSGTADPATGTGGITYTTTGPLFPACALWNGSQQSTSINGGAFPFSLSTPSGFSAWDSGAVTDDTTIRGSSPSSFQWGFGGPDITVSNSSKTASVAAGSVWESIFSTSTYFAGQHYLEFTIGAMGSSTNEQMFGLGSFGYSNTNTTTWLGNSPWTAGFQTGSTGEYWYWDSNSASGQNHETWTGSVTVGDVISLHVDCNKGLVWIKNVTQGGDYNSSASADPAQGIGGYGIGGFNGISFGWSGDSSSGTETITVNTGASAFTGTPASGYTAWDTNTTTSPSPRLDGMVQGTVGNGNTSKALSLTTLNSNDIIIVLVSSSAGNSTVPINSLVSSVTGSGLTFAQRLQQSGRNTGGGLGPNATSLEIWWALAASPLSAESITVTLAAATAGCDIYMFGVTGANTTVPFDTNSGVPVVASTGTSLTASTTSPHTLAIWMSSINGNASGSGIEQIGPSDAFIPIGFESNDNGTVMFPMVGTLATAQHSQTFGDSDGLGLDWPFMGFDAIQPPYSGTAPTIDGTVQTASFGFNNTSHSITLTTTTSGIVVCHVTIETNSIHTVNIQVASVSGGGLTWKRRWQQVSQTSGDDFRNQEIWWAVSSGALVSQSITVTLSAAADGATMIVMGVKNCTGWDPNLQLPQSTVATTSMTYNTDNALSLALLFQNSGGTGATPTGGGGGPPTSAFTLEGSVRDTSGFANAYGAIYGANQFNPVFAGTVATTTSGYASIVDVLTNNTATPYSAPVLDGSIYGTILTGTSSLALTLTTTQAGQVVVLVMTETNSGSTNGATVSSITGGGLTFTQRGQAKEHGSSGSGIIINTEEWVATSSGAIGAQSITVTLAANADGGAVAILGIGGATGPDPHAGIPLFENTSGNITGFSTTNQFDLLVWWSSSASNGGQSGLPSGFTEIATNSYNGGLAGIGYRAAIQRVNAVQSSVTITASSAGTDVINMADGFYFILPMPPGPTASMPRTIRIR